MRVHLADIASESRKICCNAAMITCRPQPSSTLWHLFHHIGCSKVDCTISHSRVHGERIRWMADGSLKDDLLSELLSHFGAFPFGLVAV